MCGLHTALTASVREQFLVKTAVFSGRAYKVVSCRPFKFTLRLAGNGNMYMNGAFDVEGTLTMQKRHAYDTSGELP